MPYDNPMREVRIVAKLADLTEELYRLQLMLDAMTMLLIEKGLLSAQELRDKAALLDRLNLYDQQPHQSISTVSHNVGLSK